MTISKAMHAAGKEYDEECLRARDDPAFHALMTHMMNQEYEEIDQELPGYAAEIFRSQNWPYNMLDPRIYQALRMAFRMGMRTQRKLDFPDLETSSFWRSDQAST